MHAHRKIAALVVSAGLVVLAGPVTATTQGSLDAQAAADVAVDRAQIEKKAAATSSRARGKAEAKLDAAARKIDAAAEKAESQVASRLAGEIGVTAEALVEQKAALGTSWGALTIAHALEANAAAGWTVEELLALRADGMGWGTIAAGLGLELGSAVKAIDAETRVALGQARADGRIAAMAGPGAVANVSTGVGLGAAGATANSTAGVGGAVSGAGAAAAGSVTSGVGLSIGR